MIINACRLPLYLPAAGRTSIMQVNSLWQIAQSMLKRVRLSQGTSEFGSRPGYTKDHHKNGTNCLPALHACVRVEV